MEILDSDNDGVISDKDLENAEKITNLKEKISKLEAQERMAWIALIAILIFTIYLLSPYVDIDRLEKISEFIGMVYITLAGIVATFMGTQAWTLRKP